MVLTTFNVGHDGPSASLSPAGCGPAAAAMTPLRLPCSPGTADAPAAARGPVRAGPSAAPAEHGRGSAAVSGPAAGRVVPAVLPGPARRARPAPLTTSM